MPPIPSVPANFTFHVEFRDMNQIVWSTMNEVFNFSYRACNGTVPFSTSLGYPSQGYNDLGGISVWVTNQRKQHIIILSFFSEDEWLKLRNVLNDNIKQHVAKITLPLYSYARTSDHWFRKGTYDPKPQEQLVGFDDYIKLIRNTIDNLILHSDFLKSIGEMKSLNFLLRGNPGMGKTSLIRLIATMYNAPICKINPQGISLGVGIEDVLNPEISTNSDIVIFLFEDFDRFLNDQDGEKIMNHLLNGIDGISTNNRGNYSVVRFFTGNDCEVIINNKALINRMTHTFIFEDPTRDMYRDKMKQLFRCKETYDVDLSEKFLDLVCQRTPLMSMRPFISYILLYLFEDNFLELLIQNLSTS